MSFPTFPFTVELVGHRLAVFGPETMSNGTLGARKWQYAHQPQVLSFRD